MLAQGPKTDPAMRHKVLVARETTDVLILDFPIDAPEAAPFSIGRALLISGARLLDLDGRELGLELKSRGGGELSLLMYDTAPSGAGHCIEPHESRQIVD